MLIYHFQKLTRHPKLSRVMFENSAIQKVNTTKCEKVSCASVMLRSRTLKSYCLSCPPKATSQADGSTPTHTYGSFRQQGEDFSFPLALSKHLAVFTSPLKNFSPLAPPKIIITVCSVLGLHHTREGKAISLYEV